MPDYVFSFYRTAAPLTDAGECAVLASLAGLDLGFFPARFLLARGKEVALSTPSSYHRSMVPGGYYIERSMNHARLPFKASSDLRFAFTEADASPLTPASLVIEFTDRTLELNRWSFPDLLRLFEACIDVMAPQYAYGYDVQHRDRAEYQEHMFEYDLTRVPTGLFWFNFFGSEWVSNVGRESLLSTASQVPVCRLTEAGAVLIAIQEAPYDERTPSHAFQQRALEALSGIPEAKTRFPNRGFSR